MSIIKNIEKYLARIIKSYGKIAIAGMIAAMPSVASATPTTIDFGALKFSSTNQGMWGSGATSGFSYNHFFGTSWNRSASLGKIYGKVSSTSTSWPHYHWPSGWHCHGAFCVNGRYDHPGHWHTHHSTLHVDTRTGVKLGIKTSGTVGFQLGLKANSGTVNTDVNYTAKLLVPDATSLGVGNFFNLNPASTLAGGTLQTNFPKLSAKLDATIGVKATFNARGCVLLSGCSSSKSTLGFAPVTFPLASFNQPLTPGKIKLFGKFDPAKFQFDRPIVTKGRTPGSVLARTTIHATSVLTLGGRSGNKLVSSGQDKLIKFAGDLDGLLLAPARLPGLGVQFKHGSTTVTGDLINVQMGPTINVKQNFEFNPSLYVNLAFNKPVNIAGKYLPRVPKYGTKHIRIPVVVGTGPLGQLRYGYKYLTVHGAIIGYKPRELAPQTSWFGRWDQLPNIALLSAQTRITPTFSVQGNLLNNTLLGLGGMFSLDVLQASISDSFFGTTFALGHIGPLYSFHKKINLFNTPPLFSKSFGLGGFNTIAGSSFLVRTASAPPLASQRTQGSRTTVPEPAPTLLLLFGLVMMGLSRRKFRRKPA